jgi:hypothetical protein
VIAIGTKVRNKRKLEAIRGQPGTVPAGSTGVVKHHPKMYDPRAYYDLVVEWEMPDGSSRIVEVNESEIEE